ncbi:septum formation family protein [Nocardioides sp. SYSU D00038]|uniref:septum formation family protein n=1 Tax=Nocardioides sp. SYSU D00038 TaxID=2812554 RepID=UPI001968968E|nr:septum formation family protein [Nocardioides sp. SYSU D00038]
MQLLLSRTAALGALLALLVSGLVSGLVAGGAAAQADPAAGQPRVGECRSYGVRTLDQVSDRSTPVSCAGPHTALTIAVVRTPKRVKLTNAAQAAAATARPCTAALARALGRNVATRALSAYQYAFFAPTKAQRAQGARWLRCDLVLGGGRRLETLPSPRLPGKPLPRTVAGCRTGKLHMTSCARPHRFRAVKVVVLGGRWPGADRLREIGRQKCKSASNKKGDYRWEWAPKGAWKAGEKRVVCLKPKR